MKLKIIFALILSEIITTGCGDSKLNCSSYDECQKSMQSLTKGMDKLKSIEIRGDFNIYPIAATMYEYNQNTSDRNKLKELSSLIVSPDGTVEFDEETEKKLNKNEVIINKLNGKTIEEIQNFNKSHQYEIEQLGKVTRQWIDTVNETWAIKSNILICLGDTGDIRNCAQQKQRKGQTSMNFEPDSYKHVIFALDSKSDKGTVAGFIYGKNFTIMLACPLEEVIDSNPKWGKCKINYFTESEMKQLNIPCLNSEYCNI